MANEPNGQGNDIAGYDAFTGSSSNSGNFLWWCAGAHIPTLRKFSTEHPKYNTLGGVLLATFVLAALSSGYAFFTIFGSTGWAISFALIWGLIIFNFDRFMVASIRKYGMSQGRQIRVALPRIVLAILIGITIARPLELKLFEKEINLQVENNLAQKIKQYNIQQDSIHLAKMATTMTERDKLLFRRKAMEDTLLSLQLSYVKEADGTGGSGKRGVEDITKLKMGAYRQTSNQFSDEFSRIDSSIGSQNRLISSGTDSLNASKAMFAAAARKNIGFLERNKALHDLSQNEESVWLANMLITLLIIILETAPILAKLLLPVGPYDIALAKEELVPMSAMERSLVTEQEKIRSSNMSAV